MRKNKSEFKIGSKEEKAWTDILEQAKARNEQLEREKAINSAVIGLAEAKILSEKERFK